jgi:hypothetical protein
MVMTQQTIQKIIVVANSQRITFGATARKGVSGVSQCQSVSASEKGCRTTRRSQDSLSTESCKRNDLAQSLRWVNGIRKRCLPNLHSQVVSLWSSREGDSSYSWALCFVSCEFAKDGENRNLDHVINDVIHFIIRARR